MTVGDLGAAAIQSIREGRRTPLERRCVSELRGSAMPNLLFGRLTPKTAALGAIIVMFLTTPTSAFAGKASWLDDVLRRVVRQAEAEGKAVVRAADGPGSRSVGRLLAHDAEEGLESLAKQSDELARTARQLDRPAETALKTRFGRLVREEPELARQFAALAPAERRLVVEMGETAQRLARRYPGQAEPMIRKLGAEGMSAVRVYGDDVAEVLVKEGGEGVDVLRKTGRGGWKFYTESVLRHKKKLAAAGVLTVFLANPEQFVDSAGRVTEYAVKQFAKAGISLAQSVGGGAVRGLDAALDESLASHGLNSLFLRRVGMVGAGLAAALAAMILLGMPVRWIVRPFTWPLRRIVGHTKG
jgi:hypothetical protein